MMANEADFDRVVASGRHGCPVCQDVSLPGSVGALL
jgi:hypothetical protein